MTGLTIGIDIAKRVFQVHAIDNATGEVTSDKLARRDFLAHFEKLPPALSGWSLAARRTIGLGS